jgi:hypothetical protein
LAKKLQHKDSMYKIKISARRTHRPDQAELWVHVWGMHPKVSKTEPEACSYVEYVKLDGDKFANNTKTLASRIAKQMIEEYVRRLVEYYGEQDKVSPIESKDLVWKKDVEVKRGMRIPAPRAYASLSTTAPFFSNNPYIHQAAPAPADFQIIMDEGVDDDPAPPTYTEA